MPHPGNVSDSLHAQIHCKARDVLHDCLADLRHVRGVVRRVAHKKEDRDERSGSDSPNYSASWLTQSTYHRTDTIYQFEAEILNKVDEQHERPKTAALEEVVVHPEHRERSAKLYRPPGIFFGASSTYQRRRVIPDRGRGSHEAEAEAFEVSDVKSETTLKL